jgi:hypothetical protein
MRTAAAECPAAWAGWTCKSAQASYRSDDQSPRSAMAGGFFADDLAVDPTAQTRQPECNGAKLERRAVLQNRKVRKMNKAIILLALLVPGRLTLACPSFQEPTVDFSSTTTWDQATEQRESISRSLQARSQPTMDCLLRQQAEASKH